MPHLQEHISILKKQTNRELFYCMNLYINFDLYKPLQNTLLGRV